MLRIILDAIRVTAVLALILLGVLVALLIVCSKYICIFLGAVFVGYGIVTVSATRMAIGIAFFAVAYAISYFSKSAD